MEACQELLGEVLLPKVLDLGYPQNSHKTLSKYKSFRDLKYRYINCATVYALDALPFMRGELEGIAESLAASSFWSRYRLCVDNFCYPPDFKLYSFGICVGLGFRISAGPPSSIRASG